MNISDNIVDLSEVAQTIGESLKDKFYRSRKKADLCGTGHCS